MGCFAVNPVLLKNVSSTLGGEVGEKEEEQQRKKEKFIMSQSTSELAFFFPEKEQKDQMSEASKNNPMIDRDIS